MGPRQAQQLTTPTLVVFLYQEVLFALWVSGAVYYRTFELVMNNISLVNKVQA